MESVGFKNTNRYNTNFTNNRYSSYQYATRTQEPPNQEVNTVAKAGLLQIFAVLLTKVSGWCGQKLMQGKEFTSADNVNKIADEMLTIPSISRVLACLFKAHLFIPKYLINFLPTIFQFSALFI